MEPVQPLQNFIKHYFSMGGHGQYGVVVAVSVGLILPLLLSYLAMSKKIKKRAVQVEVAGEAGLTLKSKRSATLTAVPWEGATTMAALFEQSCRKHAAERFLGTRKLIGREEEVAAGGRKLEKLHFGEYEWLTYDEAFGRACNFASGLVKLGHIPENYAAIFSETRAEWLIALQGCFRQNISVVTIYASLGDEALIHSLNETEVSTLICDSKQLKKFCAVALHVNSVKHVVYFQDEGNLVDSVDLERMKHQTVLSFDEVEKLGKENPVNPRLPSSSDVAVVMYTSGSTGLPKDSFCQDWVKQGRIG